MATQDIKNDPYATFLIKAELAKDTINIHNSREFSSGELANLVIKLATIGIQILPVKSNPLPAPYAVMHSVRVSNKEVEPNYLVELK